MTSSDYRKHKTALAGVVAKHFHSLSPDEIEQHAATLSGKLGVAASFETVERSDRPLAKDVESIQRAARATRQASKHLSDVGFIGSEGFPEILNTLLPKEAVLGFEPVRNRHQAQRELVDTLNNLAADLDAACAAIEKQGVSQNHSAHTATKDTSRSTKPTKTKAHLFATACAELFESKSGLRPTVSTNPNVHGNPAGGPFLEFVQDAFKAAQIEASAEHWARKAVKEFSQQKN